jgi:hypothetical protein
MDRKYLGFLNSVFFSRRKNKRLAGKKGFNILFSAMCISLFQFSTITKAQPVKEIQIPAFKNIEIVGNFEVELNIDTKDAVYLIGADSIIADAKVAVKGGTLKISDIKSVKRDKKIKVRISCQKPEKILATAGANVFSKADIHLDSLNLTCSSGATIDLSIYATKLNALVDKGGTMRLSGKVENADVEASTGGIFSAYELVCNSAVARSNSGGLVKIQAKQYLSAAVSTGGEISYRGIPKKLETKNVLGGTIEQLVE